MAKWNMSDYAVAGTSIAQNIMTLHKQAEIARSRNQRDQARQHYQQAQVLFKKAEMIKKARDSHQEHELAKNKFKLEEQKFEIEHGKDDPKERRKWADKFYKEHPGQYTKADASIIDLWAHGYGGSNLNLSNLSMFSGRSGGGSRAGSGGGGVRPSGPQGASINDAIIDLRGQVYGMDKDEALNKPKRTGLKDVAEGLKTGFLNWITETESEIATESIADLERMLVTLNQPMYKDQLMGTENVIYDDISKYLPAIRENIQKISEKGAEAGAKRIGIPYENRQAFLDLMNSKLDKIEILSSQKTQQQKGYWDQPYQPQLTGQQAADSLQGMSLEPSAPEQAPQNDYRRLAIEGLFDTAQEGMKNESASRPIAEGHLPSAVRTDRKTSEASSSKLPPLFQHLEGESEDEIAPSGQYSELFKPTERAGFEGTGFGHESNQFQGRPISIPKTESLGLFQGVYNKITEGTIRSNVTFIEEAAKLLTKSPEKKPKLFEKMMTNLNLLGYPEPPDDDLTLSPATKKMIEKLIETYTKSGVQGPVGEGYTAPPTAPSGNWWDRGTE